MVFYGTLASVLNPGHSILIVGKTTENAKHLEIDFLSAKSDKDNLILHLCIRLDKQSLTINTKIDGVWCVGHQIKLTNFNAGEMFNIKVFLKDDEFLISFNNGLNCTYPYRTNIAKMAVICVSADVEYVTQLLEKNTFSNMTNGLMNEANFTNNIGRSFVEGDVIIMKGLVQGSNTGSFSIVLYDQNLGYTVFKLSLDFKNKRIIYSGDVEHSDLEHPHSKIFPFVLNETFKIAIGFHGSYVFVAVEGELYLKFKFHKAEHINSSNGFSLLTTDELQIKMSSVDHFNIENDQWSLFETYSNLECTCT